MDPRIGFRPDLLQYPSNFNNSSVSNAALSYSVSDIAHKKQSYYWTNWSSGQATPQSAVRGGVDVDGTSIYVGRAHHCGDLIPAKVMPDKNVAYIPYGGDEISVYNCEILCQQTFQWIHSGDGHVPMGAVPIGHTSDGETLYAARVFHEGSHCVGKMHPSHRACYVPFGGREHSHSNYEILVLTDLHHCC